MRFPHEMVHIGLCPLKAAVTKRIQCIGDAPRRIPDISGVWQTRCIGDTTWCIPIRPGVSYTSRNVSHTAWRLPYAAGVWETPPGVFTDTRDVCDTPVSTRHPRVYGIRRCIQTPEGVSDTPWRLQYALICPQTGGRLRLRVTTTYECSRIGVRCVCPQSAMP